MKYPKLVKPEKYFKFANMIKKIDNIGFGNIKIVDKAILNEIEVPEFLYKLCSETGLDIEEMINTILKDFVVRYISGNNVYEKGILNKIYNSNLKNKDKKELLKIILTK